MSNGEDSVLSNGPLMIDVGGKEVTHRVAKAECTVTMQPTTLRAVEDNRLPKGDVMATARVAGVMAAKNTSAIVPLCHPLPLDHVEIGFDIDPKGVIRITSTVGAHARTGVEMEALAACSAAALTVYDMCKMVERGIVISGLRLLSKSGGKTGDYVAK